MAINMAKEEARAEERTGAEEKLVFPWRW